MHLLHDEIFYLRVVVLNMKDIFVDRFLKFTTSQGVVRLDFGRVESIDNEKNEISVSPSTRLVLPLDGFNHFIEQALQYREKVLNAENGAKKSDGAKQEIDSLCDKKNDNESVH